MIHTLANARDVAVLALHEREGNVTANLERLLSEAPLSPADRSLSRELALGALRRRGTIRAVLNKFLADPSKHLPGVLSEILQVAMYQLLFLDRVPEFAAVNEAVEQATRFQHRRQTGLVNGVLRNAVRNLGPFEAGPPPMAGDVIPVGPRQFRRSLIAVFPDPQANMDGYMAAAYSLPVQLVQRWLRQYGAEQVQAIATHANVRAPLIARVNSARSSVQAVLDMMRAESVEAGAHSNGLSVVLPHVGGVEQLPGFTRGFFQPQDPTATEVGRVTAELALGAKPVGGPSSPVRVLDFCAAPGTKTTHVAQLLAGRGEVLAMDTSDAKLAMIVANCRRLGIDNVKTALAHQAGGLTPQSFDVVLADVPCSNTGVLARRAEARWRFSEDSLAKLVADQQFLIAAAAVFVAPGGHLVYSTCSIEQEEGPALVRHFRQKFGQWALMQEKLTLPEGSQDPACWHDGGYVAVLRC